MDQPEVSSELVAAQENHPLFLSIFACIGGVAFLSFEVRSFALAA